MFVHQSKITHGQKIILLTVLQSKALNWFLSNVELGFVTWALVRLQHK